MLDVAYSKYTIRFAQRVSLFLAELFSTPAQRQPAMVMRDPYRVAAAFGPNGKPCRIR